ncbi:MAG: FHA domain-containing protein, partial [Polyangiales bacterium]
MSFAIIISEKGGQERREVFDKNEISIGRVQGNDLLLPKGNVSKRHARIVFRDGRFIVTDLKSTNGSYVNGHRIAQATIVREGDKIYIGDFVLKVDAGGASSSSPMSPGGRDGRPQDTDGTHNEDDRGLGTPPPRIAGVDGSAVSHIPLEQDPDDASGQSHPQVGQSRGGGDTRPPRVPQPQAQGAPLRASTVGAPPPARPSGAAPPPLPAQASVPAPPPLPPAAPSQALQPVAPKAAVAKPKARAGHANALRALLERLADVVDLDEGDVFAPPTEAKRASVEKVLREQARALQQASELPAAVTSDELVREALDEALHVGPLGALLDDDGVRAIHVHRHDAITAVRDEGIVALEIGFTSEISLRRALGRLARASGVTLREGDIEISFRLGARGTLRALLPPAASSGTILTIRRPLGAAASLDDAVRAGVLSRPMAALLQLAVTARSNVLIVGPSGAAPLSFAHTLVSGIAADDR